MAHAMTARQAYQLVKMNNPIFNAEIQKALAAKAVAPVFIEDAEKIKGDYRTWLEKSGLISKDPTVKKARVVGGGVNNINEADKIVGGLLSKMREMLKQVNEKLKDTKYEAFLYVKNSQFVKAEQPTVPPPAK